MEQEIIVTLVVENNEENVNVSYSIQMCDEIQTIVCKVKYATHSMDQWLHIRNFELRSELSSLGYVPLFTDNANVKNIEDSIFIDKAYHDIMAREKFKLAS